MAALTIDQILNFIIPIGVWCFLGYVLYKPFKEPIDKLINKISEWRDGREEEVPWAETVKTIEYE